MALTFGDFNLTIGWWFILVVLVVAFILWRRSRRDPVSIGEALLKVVGRFSNKSALTISDAEGEVKENTVAVVKVYGPILDEVLAAPQLSRVFATFGTETRELLDALAKNKNIVGVIVKFNTPGGTVTGSHDIFEGIRACAAIKPTVAYVSSLCASGGVWAMVGAQKVIAAPSSLIGSIGVAGPTILEYVKPSDMGGGLFGGSVRAEEIRAEVLSAGAHKQLGNPFVPLEQKKVGIQYLKRALDQVYDRFVSHVAQHRTIAEKAIRDIGAAILSERDAKKIGLVDVVGDFEVAKAEITSKLKTARENLRFDLFQTKRKPRGFADLSMSARAQGGARAAHDAVVMSLESSPIKLYCDVGMVR